MYILAQLYRTGYRDREALLGKEAERTLTKSEYGKLEALKAKCESQLEFLGRMWNKSGVQVVSGTDAIRMFGDYCLGLELMSEAGMSNMDIIKASTSIAAESMGITEITGSIKPGKQADLIVVDQKPTAEHQGFTEYVYGDGRGGASSLIWEQRPCCKARKTGLVL